MNRTAPHVTIRILFGFFILLGISLNVLAAAAFELTKTVTTVSGTCPGSTSLTVDEGDAVKYCYTIRNSGDVAARDLWLMDDTGTPGTYVDIGLSGLTDEDGDGSSDDLAPGAEATADLQWLLDSPGAVTNTALIQGYDLVSGTLISDTDSVSVTVNDLVAVLELTKTATTSSGACPGSASLTVDEGDAVKYCYTIRNTGDAAARDLWLMDDTGTPGTYLDIDLSGLTDEDGDGSSDDLAPGAEATADLQWLLISPGSVTNTATIRGYDVTSGSLISDSDSMTVSVNDRVAELNITKTVTTQNGSCPGASSLTVDEGDTVKYCYVIENPGDAAVRDLRVTDDEGMPGNPFPAQITMTGLSDEDGDGSSDDLAPGATATGSHQITLMTPGPATNTATASGQDVTSSGDVSDTDSVTVTVNDRVAVLEITKTVSQISGSCPGSTTLTVDEGDKVLYCYVVENTGDAAVRDLRVTDDEGMPGNINPQTITMSGLTDEDGDGSSDDLAPGATATGGLQMTLVSPGSVTNTATASGQDVTSSGDVSDTDSVTVTVSDRVAVLEITKTVSEIGGTCPGSTSLTVDEGDMVLYCYTVTNTGDAAVRDLRVTDDEGMPGNINPQTITMSGLTDEDGDGNSDDLAPGATASGGLQMTLVSPGSVTNTATASGQDVTSSGDVSDTDSVTVTVNDRVAELRLTKTVTTQNGACPGSTSLTVDEGDTVKYCYVVENIGDAAATDVSVVDDYGTPGQGIDDRTITLSGLTDEDGIGGGDLAPGATATGELLVSLYTPGSVTNTANASGTDITSSGTVADADSATVTVTNTPPEIHDCPENQYIANPNKRPTVAATWTPPTASDSSGVPPLLTSTHNPGDSFPVGITEVSYTATDAQGATSACTFVFFVGEEVRVKWTATSNLDLASVQASTASGQLLDTSEGGKFTFEVTATDITGLSATESVEYIVLFLLRPPPSLEMEWTEEWLWIDNVLPPNERMLIGSVPISAVYTSGNPVTVFFALCDVDGHAMRDCIASLSVTKVRNPEIDEPYKDLMDVMLKYYSFRYDRERGGYFFELQTFGYEPGYYDLWIAVNSVLQQRIRIQVLEPQG